MSELKPPRIVTEDTGTHDISESSDDHFSSASEGDGASQRMSEELSTPQMEIPITRVERVDDSPAHGEVPGTLAYSLRTQDAVPDEIEIVPEGQRSRSGTQSRSRAASIMSAHSRPQTPGGSPIPRTVVEKVDNKPSHGEVVGTLAHEQRMADAEPDEVRVVDTGDTTSSNGRTVEQEDPGDQQAWLRSMWAGKKEDDIPSLEADVGADADADEGDDFGDDFDDFAEGGGDDDDFGDFDDAGDQTAPASTSEPILESGAGQQGALYDIPFLDPLRDLSAEDYEASLQPYLDAIFPDSSHVDLTEADLDMTNSSPFLSERSLSLWQQLVQPPPMQPPNWTRSRIRRLFLVSLGVPVDLDEILPPSKQKRLILPNINLGSPRASTSALERLKQADNNASSSSLDSKTGAPKRSKRAVSSRGPAPPPEFDANTAALICGTTEEALAGLGDAELREHVTTLEALNQTASTVLEYWLQRKDDALKEKEALEGVIENLVGFVKGRRGK